MPKQIWLEMLSVRAPAITPGSVGFYKESCIVCMSEQAHDSGVALHVEFESDVEQVVVWWEGAVTPQMLRAYADQKKRTDDGACAIALLIIPEFTGYVAIQQSATWNGIDYHLTTASSDDDLIFNNAANLEVSGIQVESPGNTIAGRIQAKRRRLRKQRINSLAVTEDLPTYICVVEFGRPQVKVAVA